MNIAYKEIKLSHDDREYVQQLGTLLMAAGFQFHEENGDVKVTSDSANKIRNNLGLKGEEDNDNHRNAKNSGHSRRHDGHSKKEHMRETEKELPGVVLAKSIRQALERAEGLKIEYTEEELENKKLQQTMQQISAAKSLVSGLDRADQAEQKLQQDRLLQHEKKAELVEEKQKQASGKESKLMKTGKELGDALFLVLAPDHWVDAYLEAQQAQNKEKGVIGKAVEAVKTVRSLISEVGHSAKKPDLTPPGTAPAKEQEAVLPFSTKKL